MNDVIDEPLLVKLRKLYREDEAAKSLLDWAASRTNDAAETSIERIMQKAGTGRSKALELARSLEKIGCGEFTIGRKGWKSRMRWSFSLVSLGQAAKGQTSKLKEVDQEVKEDVADQQLPSGEAPGERPLTIADAKRGLAAAFNVSPDAIDIVIRG